MVTNLSEQLRRDEGERLSAYQDKFGFWTIGVGRLIDVRKGGKISKEESEMLLANDIANVEHELNERLPWNIKLDPVRRAVLLNMAFNLGCQGLMNFRRFLALVDEGDYAGASIEMLDSLWAHQLPERADRLAKQMKTGEWQ